jgi:recombination protein RecR
VTTPGSLARLVDELERLPGIGRRSAERLAHHLLRVPEERALALADAIRAARTGIRPCSLCRAPTERDPCPICADPGRERDLLMVVETARDMAAIEAGGRYRGLYHVLGGRLSPLDPSSAGAGDVEALRERVRAGGVREVCLATNPDLEGDGTALEIARVLAASGVLLTRLARGLPTGGQIEYQNPAVLADAFEGRRPLA